MAAKDNRKTIIRLYSYLFTTIIIVVLLLGNIVSTLQPPVNAAEETSEFSLADLPPKGNPKLDSALNQLISDKKTADSEALIAEERSPFGEDIIRVIIESVPGRSNGTIATIASLGAVEGTYGDYIQMVVPVSNISRLADIAVVKQVRVPMQPLVSAVTSEGVPLINADDWQTAGYDGTGIKIGILDVGFAGYTARQVQGDLPPSLNTWWAPSIGNEGTNVHGTACAEIVYDIAPGATYYLANFSTLVEYGNAVDWLIAQGVDIISCSVGWPVSGPGDGTGPICDIVETATAADILWVQSAGNQAQRHWQGDYSNEDGDQFHDFPGTDSAYEFCSIRVNYGDTVTAALKWDDPWYGSANDFDLLLYDSSLNLVAYSMNIQDGDDSPFEILSYTYTADLWGYLYIAIGTLGDPSVVNFHLYSYYQDLEYQTASSSITIPADSPNTLAVGAVDYHTPRFLEEFSSQGPTDDGRIKPDLVAPDGVSTASYGTNNFFGTSASAPHAAGVAVLVKNRFPGYNKNEILTHLETNALDIGSIGKDNLFGTGFLTLGTLGAGLDMKVNGVGTVTPSFGNHYCLPGTEIGIRAIAASGWQFSHWNGDTETIADIYANDTTVICNNEITVVANFIPVNDGWIIQDLSFKLGTHNLNTSLALDSYGIPFISCSPSISNEALRVFTWTGEAWINDFVESPTDTDRRYPSLVIDDSNTLQVAYQIFPEEELMYAVYDGFTWFVQTVDDYGRPGSYISIALDSNQNPHISFFDQSNYDLEYAHWDGTGWQIQSLETEGSAGAYSSIAIDSNDYPHISYWGDGQTLNYTRWDGTSWQTETIDTEPSGYYSLVLDSLDHPHISYFTDSGYLKYANWDGSFWQIQTIGDCDVMYTAIDLDSNEYPHIAYQRNANLYHAFWNGTQWISETVDSTIESGMAVSLEIDTSVVPNVVHISYCGGDRPYLKYARKSLNSLLLSISIDGHGTTTPPIGNHYYAPNTVVNISADPDSGWEFVNWTGDVANPNSTDTTVTMDTDKTVTAHFIETGATDVTFPDPNLEAVIREAIGKPTGDIYNTDLLPLTTLGADDKNISDLTGLEYCINLASLELSYNQISDISPLGNLTNLNSLGLLDNQISDISLLASLINLTYLNLAYNQITDISALTDLDSLVNLDLYHNQITDILALSGLTNLTELMIYDNQIGDISALEYLINLSVLFLGSNQISDFSVLANLTNLQYLSLSHNQISDLSPLTDLNNLATLLLSGNQISDLSPLANLTNLAYLDAETNQISNLSPLANLTNLTSLFLGQNQISDISPLQNLTNLTSLSLSHNQISDISPLAGLNNLGWLFLSENQIADISELANLTKLEYLFLQNNQITDILPLVANSGIDAEDQVDLRNNPLNAESIYLYIPELQNRGVNVLYDNQPVSVTTNAASDITSTSSMLNGNLASPGAHGSMEVSFEWGETPGGPYPNETTPAALMLSAGPFSYNLIGLSPNTPYYFRAKAVGVITIYGDEQEFTTSNTPPTAPVVDVTPNLPVADEDLVCTIITESTDLTSDTITYTYEWFKNGVLQLGETTTGTTALTDTMYSSTTAGETWKCVVTPNDGSVNGPPAEDQTIIVTALTTGTVTSGTPDAVLDAIAEADIEVEALDGTATVTVAEYQSNPGTGFNGDIGKHIDVYIDDTTLVTEIEIRLYYTDAEISGKVETSLKLNWWNGTAWQVCSDSGVDTTDIPNYSGYIWARIRSDTTPALNELEGTPFGATAATQQSPGGGGGGGGGMVGVLACGYIIDSQGRINTEARAISENAEAYLLLESGTYCLLEGFPPSFIFIFPLEEEEHPPIPEYTNLVSSIFDLGPDGCTFDPAIKLIFNYDSSNIPEGFDEQDMYIATWDEENGKWVRLESHLDLEGETIKTDITGFSLYAVMAGTKPANISVSDLTIMPEEIYEGDDAIATAFIVNSGDLTGTYEAVLRINDTIEETKVVDITGNDTVSVSFDLTGLEYGTYQIAVGEATKILTVLEVIEPTPAAFTTSSLEISPDEVDIGEDVNISVRVDNTGETEGVCQLVCKVNGVFVDEKDITLAGGSGELVVFTTTFDEAGKKLIEINETIGSLIVKGDTLPPEQIPLPSEEEQGPSDGTIASMPTQEVIEDSGSTNTGNWLLIIAIIGGSVVVFVVVLLLILRRRGSGTSDNST